MREKVLEAQIVPEVNVLIAVAKWLHLKGWQIERASMPHGRGIDSVINRKKLEAELTSAGIPINNIKFMQAGEDIRARQGNNLWKIECKCLGSGKRTTDKNHFDRGVASIVSYYTQEEGLRLGLALPEGYERYLKNKLPQALREAINLWLFIYVSADDFLAVFEPEEELPL